MTAMELIQRDYRDICYFVDHVKDVEFRMSLIESLGYKVGWNVANSKENTEKSYIIGANNEIRVQISPAKEGFKLVRCAIIDSQLTKKVKKLRDICLSENNFVSLHKTRN